MLSRTFLRLPLVGLLLITSIAPPGFAGATKNECEFFWNKCQAFRESAARSPDWEFLKGERDWWCDAYESRCLADCRATLDAAVMGTLVSGEAVAPEVAQCATPEQVCQKLSGNLGRLTMSERRFILRNCSFCPPVYEPHGANPNNTDADTYLNFWSGVLPGLGRGAARAFGYTDDRVAGAWRSWNSGTLEGVMEFADAMNPFAVMRDGAIASVQETSRRARRGDYVGAAEASAPIVLGSACLVGGFFSAGVAWAACAGAALQALPDVASDMACTAQAVNCGDAYFASECFYSGLAQATEAGSEFTGPRGMRARAPAAAAVPPARFVDGRQARPARVPEQQTARTRADESPPAGRQTDAPGAPRNRPNEAGAICAAQTEDEPVVLEVDGHTIETGDLITRTKEPGGRSHVIGFIGEVDAVHALQDHGYVVIDAHMDLSEVTRPGQDIFALDPDGQFVFVDNKALHNLPQRRYHERYANNLNRARIEKVEARVNDFRNRLEARVAAESDPVRRQQVQEAVRPMLDRLENVRRFAYQTKAHWERQLMTNPDLNVRQGRNHLPVPSAFTNFDADARAKYASDLEARIKGAVEAVKRDIERLAHALEDSSISPEQRTKIERSLENRQRLREALPRAPDAVRNTDFEFRVSTANATAPDMVDPATGRRYVAGSDGVRPNATAQGVPVRNVDVYAPSPPKPGKGNGC